MVARRSVHSSPPIPNALNIARLESDIDISQLADSFNAPEVLGSLITGPTLLIEFSSIDMIKVSVVFGDTYEDVTA
jgi:hypothetical protein